MIPTSDAGVAVTEESALGVSAVWRAVSLLAGTMASLPLRSYRELDDGATQRVKSFLDSPGGPVAPGLHPLTPYTWVETLLTHLLLCGNAYLLHVYGGAGQVVGLQLLHPSTVGLEATQTTTGWLKTFRVNLQNGTSRVYGEDQLTHISGLSLNGVWGLSPITIARNSLGVSIAGDKAAARVFASGALISGLITPDGEDADSLTAEDAQAIADDVNNNVGGIGNAGKFAVMNRQLKLQPWTLSMADAQFLESRAFQVEEVARWFGVPSYLLADQAKQTSWGTGVEVQGASMGRHVLLPWARRIEQALSRLLPSPRWCEFDFAGLERPNLKDELALLQSQVNQGFLTLNEARAIRDLPPIDGGNELRVPSGVMLMSQLVAAADAAANPPEPEPEPEPPTDDSPDEASEGEDTPPSEEDTE